ncbi:glycosyltransferase [Aporhodopirellula aestuarii]|uniref:Glycosyltransferase family 1 protein n=1 Tax=Aporhodopirellula aestuarii TaxID=2950107 RepID=A0ABT0U8M8_9BACT|nr:glycosyltransferase [Aporhodopirellula aestuarii]MCM2373044.1 glycosyltransferase family 1 protein [Aporhodopirellula aestuarii]
MSSQLAMTSSNRPTASPPAVLWVTRRYWPHGAGHHARAAASLALSNAWSAMGTQVEVVTPRYAASWSDELFYDTIHVHRIASAPKGEWSMQRYVRHLGNWLSEQANRFDWIICDGITDDVRSVATAIIHARGEKQRTRGGVLCDGWGADSDEVWCRQSRAGKRCLHAITTLDQIFTRHSDTDRALVAKGIPSHQIHRIASGFARPNRVSLDQRNASRRSLEGINTDLRTDGENQVLLWCGHMTGRHNTAGGAKLIVSSARLLCAKYPNLRIWMLGDGELHDWIHTELKAEGVRSVVAIPGTFPDMTDIWNAVDAVAVTDEDQLRYTLPNAIAHALPTIVADHASIRAWMSDKFATDIVDSFAWYDSNKPTSFRKTFRTVWDDLPAAVDLAWEVAIDASRRFSITEELNQWASVFSSDSHVHSS